jgi:RNA-directed DNA polymerase
VLERVTRWRLTLPHARFGERDGETRLVRAMKVRAVPTPLSPLLANIVLHYVLDEWYEHEVKPRMNGRCFLSRFAHDFIIGFEREENARRVIDVLPKRFNRFGLTIHPTKTALISFGKPDFHQETDRGNGTFEFLGFARDFPKLRQGYWVIKRKTASKCLRRTKKSLWQWCSDHRHTPLPVQYRMLCQKLRVTVSHMGYRATIVCWRAFSSMRRRCGGTG